MVQQNAFLGFPKCAHCTVRGCCHAQDTMTEFNKEVKLNS